MNIKIRLSDGHKYTLLFDDKEELDSFVEYLTQCIDQGCPCVFESEVEEFKVWDKIVFNPRHILFFTVME